MFARFTPYSSVQFFAFTAVKDKSFIKFGHISRANIRRLRKFLQCNENFMAHMKDWLMIQAEAFGRKVNGVAVKGICNDLFPDRSRKVRIVHYGICSRHKCVPTIFAEKTLFFALKAVSDD